MRSILLLAFSAAFISLSSCKDQDSTDAVEESEFKQSTDTENDAPDQSDARIREESEVKSSNRDDINDDANSNQNEKVEAGKVLKSYEKTKEINAAKSTDSKVYKAVVLSSNALILFENSGRQDRLSFGQSASTVIQKMNNYLGKSSSDEVETDCNGKKVRIVEWDENISLNFVGSGNNAQLAGWNLQARDKNASKFKTTSGLTVGKKRMDISAISNVKPIKTSLGYLEKTESLNAIFSTSEKDAVLTYLFAGVNCYAIEEGVTPESDKS